MNGTEKQIAWANDILKQKLECCEENLKRTTFPSMEDQRNIAIREIIKWWSTRKTAKMLIESRGYYFYVSDDAGRSGEPTKIVYRLIGLGTSVGFDTFSDAKKSLKIEMGY